MNMTPFRLQILDDPAATAAAAADEFWSRSQRAINEGRTFACALSGGSTPKLLFANLADPERPPHVRTGFWDSVHFFWGDERAVPPDHPESNYRLAHEELLRHIRVPAANIHRIRAELGARSAAAEYERELRVFFRLAAGEIPRFDLIYLGMGEDGHTASLFPDSEVLQENTHPVAAARIPKLDAFRITLTLPVFQQAACIIFMVCGESKAEALRRVLFAPTGGMPLPARQVRPARGELLWLVDRSAASRLPPSELPGF